MVDCTISCVIFWFKRFLGRKITKSSPKLQIKWGLMVMDDVQNVTENFEQEYELGRLHRLNQRCTESLAKVEGMFLSVLRYSALLIAGLVLVGAAITLGYGAFQQSGRTSVDPNPVSLAAGDLTPEPITSQARKADAAKAKLTVSAEVRRQTLDVYRVGFKGFQRADTKITDQQIVDFVWTEDRIQEFQSLDGKLKDVEGKPLVGTEAVMRNALSLVKTAATTDEFRKRLEAFRSAKKVNVCNDEVRTRSRSIQTWNVYGTNCPNWYESPVGCPATRTVDEPYTEKVCVMKYPDNLEAPSQQLASAVQRYGDIAGARLEKASNDAEDATSRNYARKAEGRENWSLSFKLFLGFMAVMFLYLFVAMERHHRSLRALIAQDRQATKQ